ncbi:MAG: putative ABC transporter permease [Lachnospiraceae bacterium]|jgi:uncharacterized membrane protein
MNATLLTSCKLIIELFFFSCAGWMMEVILKYRQYHRFINRGYLIGPYCPIYGCGVVTLTVIVEEVAKSNRSAEIFLIGVVVCGALEYLVSWGMEKLFHARWWDYSKKPMNLYGRIWIGNLILFGLGTVCIIKWINPWFFGILKGWPAWALILSAVVITVVLVTDNIISAIMMNVVRKEIDARDEDNTEEITRRVRELLRDHNLLIRRINAAYPNLQARPAHLTAQLKAAKRELEAARKNIERELQGTKLAEAQERMEQAIEKLHQIQAKFESDHHGSFR